MIVTFAGNRPDEAGAAVVRFPVANVEWVGRRIERLLSALHPAAVVGAAAAGADLLVLAAAAQNEITCQVVLPFGVDMFAATSVADRDPEWARRYDQLMNELPAEQLHAGHADPSDADAYRQGNAMILDVAQELAGNDVVVAVVVRPARDDAAPSVTDDFAARAEARGMCVIDIDPGLTQRTMRTAVVLMPDGVGADPTGRPVDYDAIFARVVVPALEDADLDWSRAEPPTVAGAIPSVTLERLTSADVAIVESAFVIDRIDELRGVSGRQTTVVIAPEHARSSSGTTMARRVGYRSTGPVPSDREVVDALRRLRLELSRLAC